MTSTISELEQARHYLAKCQQRLSEMRALMVRIPVSETINRIMAGFALEDATTAFLAALSWVWDAQKRTGFPNG